MELRSSLRISQKEYLSFLEEKIERESLTLDRYKFYGTLTYFIFSIWRIREDSQYFSEEISWNAQLVIP